MTDDELEARAGAERLEHRHAQAMEVAHLRLGLLYAATCAMAEGRMTVREGAANAHGYWADFPGSGLDSIGPFARPVMAALRGALHLCNLGYPISNEDGP